MQRAFVSTEQLITLDRMQRWAPPGDATQDGRTWGLVSPGVLSAPVSKVAR